MRAEDVDAREDARQSGNLTVFSLILMMLLLLKEEM
jgi:hypothetical protein